MTAKKFIPKDPMIKGFDETALMALNETSPVLKEKRDLGFQKYKDLPWPTMKTEEWRRTNPDTFPYQLLAQAAPLSRIPAGPPRENDSDFDLVVEIAPTGYSISETTTDLDQKVNVSSLAEIATTKPELLRAHLDGTARIRGPRKFTAFNDAFWNVGLAIEIAPKATLEKGILIRYRQDRSGALIPRLLVMAGQASEAVIAEHYLSDDDDVFCVGARELYLEDAARLKIVSLHEWGRNTWHIGEDWASVGRDATVDWVSFNLGGHTSKLMVGCDCHSPNSSALLGGVFFADGRQHVDQRTLQMHSSPNTYSNLLYKGVVKDKAHSIYQGIIGASKKSINVDSYQMNHNLVLNSGARADSLPGLEIDADDLKCSHGATIGNLNPDEIYYLRTRGLSDIDARRMLIEGFFEEIIARIPYPFMQQRVRGQIHRKIEESPRTA